jgi:hypothetical protein
MTAKGAGFAGPFYWWDLASAASEEAEDALGFSEAVIARFGIPHRIRRQTDMSVATTGPGFQLGLAAVVT